MKVSKRTDKIINIVAVVLGILTVPALQLVYPHIAKHFGNPPWLASALTLLIIGSGIPAAAYLLWKRKSDRQRGDQSVDSK